MIMGDKLGLCRDNGQEIGNYYMIIGDTLGLCRDNGQEIGSYYMSRRGGPQGPKQNNSFRVGPGDLCWMTCPSELSSVLWVVEPSKIIFLT